MGELFVGKNKIAVSNGFFFLLKIYFDWYLFNLMVTYRRKLQETNQP